MDCAAQEQRYKRPCHLLKHGEDGSEAILSEVLEIRETAVAESTECPWYTQDSQESLDETLHCEDRFPEVEVVDLENADLQGVPVITLRSNFALTVVLSCLGALRAVQAGVICSGGFTSPPPDRPLDLTSNGVNSGLDLWLLPEQQGYVLTAGLSTSTPTAGSYNCENQPGSYVIPAGTRVNSYYVYARKGGNETLHEGTITFDGPILGVMISPPELTSGSNFLGAADVLYPGGNWHAVGLEFCSEDGYSISPDGFTLSVHLRCGTPGDRMRIVTAAPACPADLDASGLVDLADLATLLTHFGGSCSPGDLDGDTDVDLSDLAALLAQFGAECH